MPRGGFQLSRKLRQELGEILRYATICKSIAEVADLNGNDKKGMIANSEKIIKIVKKYVVKEG